MQRYVSNELAHFVGRSLAESDRYELLVKIIKSGWLTHPPHMPNVSGNLSITGGAFSKNEMYSPQVVCFCDIPASDLKIHSLKYSRFGLSFSKSFLIAKGAVPVWYLPRAGVPAMQRLMLDLPTLPVGMRGSVQQNVETMGGYFDRMVRASRTVLDRLEPPLKDPRVLDPDIEAEVEEVAKFWDFVVFSNIKFFDHNLDAGAPDNFYMEREWRIQGNVRFEVGDIETVFLPKEYGGRLRKDVPCYENQVVFLGE